jgi:hypothetical protein
VVDEIPIEVRDLKAEATGNLHDAKAVVEEKDDADARKAVVVVVTEDDDQ